MSANNRPVCPRCKLPASREHDDDGSDCIVALRGHLTMAQGRITHLERKAKTAENNCKAAMRRSATGLADRIAALEKRNMDYWVSLQEVRSQLRLIADGVDLTGEGRRAA